MEGSAAPEQGGISMYLNQMDAVSQRFLDRVAPYCLYRWLSLVGLLGIFLLRMYILEGFYIVTYILAIFILNQFILFLQPKDREALAAAQSAASALTADDSGLSPLPTTMDDEFRPFVRRLPEFKFWYSCTYATILSILATFFKVLDIPVFWPILVLYFIILFTATMRRQWLDMRRLKYVPWDIGAKRTYKTDPKKLSVRAKDPASSAQTAQAMATARPSGPVPTINLHSKKGGPPSTVGSVGASTIPSSPSASSVQSQATAPVRNPTAVVRAAANNPATQNRAQ